MQKEITLSNYVWSVARLPGFSGGRASGREKQYMANISAYGEYV